MRRSWAANADAWARTVREGRIPSRERVTNAAVLQAVLASGATSVLDVGCGEGWLCRALAAEGREVVGIDGSAALIEAARQGPGSYHDLDYDRLIAERDLVPGPFGVVVCNFSLLGDGVVPLLAALRQRLGPQGRLVIQTLHPGIGWAAGAYRDGWREETFAGLGEGFRAPMPWYFRTLASWSAALAQAGLVLAELREPRASQADPPASLLLIAAVAATHTPQG